MIEVKGDLWGYPSQVKCITTNGQVNRMGAAVMGRGCAREAREKRPEIKWELAWLLENFGNQTQVICTDYGLGTILVAFPVKRIWNEKADLELIKRSASQLLDLADVNCWGRIVLPRPGCGNGGRDWENEVRPIIQPLLRGDRFHIISKPEEV